MSSPHRGSSHLSLALLGSLSVAREYLALRDGPRGFRPAFTCLVLLRCRIDQRLLSPTGLSPATAPHSRGFGWDRPPGLRSYNPTRTSPGGLGWSAFARRYLRSRFCFPFLRVLRCFSSPGWPLATYGFSDGWFGHPGINARLTAPPGISQSSHALLRLLAPRHPPHALSSLAALILPSLTSGQRPREGSSSSCSAH